MVVVKNYITVPHDRIKTSAIVVGTRGGDGGTIWDDGVYHGVREIKLIYGSCIDSIQVVYDKNGKPITAPKHGGIGGSYTAEIKLQFPEEYLLSVSGHHSAVVYGGSPVIRSLTFKSNKRTFGPFGVEEGIPFTFSIDEGQIVGLKGRGGWYLDAIGFHMSMNQSPNFFQKVQRNLKRLTNSVSIRDGGTIWDDGAYHGVREIKLVYDHCIDSIQVVYDKNGKPITAPKRGGIGGSYTAEIKLQFPEEYLLSVRGHHSTVVYGGSPVIRSLTFKSNRRTFGPFGVEEGVPFTFAIDGGQIVGLKGRGGWYLDAIGFHLSMIQSPNLFQKVQRNLKRLTNSVSSSCSISKDNINKTY
ncbi:hypothetical protein ACFE04_008622 [Oxalis oulophora]